MSASPLVETIRLRLRDVGYDDVGTPFRVAGVEFAFTGAMRGSHGRSLDLVLLFDTTTGDFGDRDADRIRQRVEALGRALDVTGSRFVITAVLAGASLTAGVDALAESCRVLQVENVALDAHDRPADEGTLRRLDDQIRLLLPLTLPEPVAELAEGRGPAIDQFFQALPKTVDRAMVEALVAAAADGEDAVTRAAGLVLGAQFESETEEGQA